MARTTNIYTRIEPEIKEEAEAILNQLGIPMSNAINLFLRQVVLQRGIPFSMKLPPADVPLCLGNLSKEQISEELEKGMNDVHDGKVISSEQVKNMMKQDYGI